MMFHIFSILDVRVGVYNPPYYAKTVAEGWRMFEATKLDPETMVAKFPNDFVLVHLGQYDDQSGEFDAHLPRMPSEEAVARPAEVTQ